jgi:hypothetical protein
MCLYINMCINLYGGILYIYVYVCIHTYLHIYINVYIHIYAYTYIQLSVHTHMYRYMYIHLCIQNNSRSHESGENVPIHTHENKFSKNQNYFNINPGDGKRMYMYIRFLCI